MRERHTHKRRQKKNGIRNREREGKKERMTAIQIYKHTDIHANNRTHKHINIYTYTRA